MARSPWFPYGRDAAPDGLRLFCFPPAGGGASGYRAWLPAFGSRVDVVPVQLPGREARLAEEPIGAAPRLVEQLVAPVMAEAGPRFALFGHSMGALLAFDLAHALTELGRPPVQLVVSGHLPPHLLHLREWEAPAAVMSDADLRSYIKDKGGTPQHILDLPELMDLVLPCLRADLGLCQAYRHTPRPPLPVPITALGGDRDRVVSPDRLARWSECTAAGFRMKVLPGTHHYLFDDVAAMVDALSWALCDPVRPLSRETEER